MTIPEKNIWQDMRNALMKYDFFFGKTKDGQGHYQEENGKKTHSHLGQTKCGSNVICKFNGIVINHCQIVNVIASNITL